MKISVIIPAYNAAATIDRTIRSVLEQTLAPLEILVLDDGSKDDTFARAQSHGPRVTVFQTPNGGLSRARNYLYKRAQGDVIAFVDCDDVWHPSYLELQKKLLTAHPAAVASVFKYFNFREDAEVVWTADPKTAEAHAELLPSEEFFRRYNKTPVLFLPSFACIPKKSFERLGPEPFQNELKGTDDFYFFNALSLQGPVVYLDQPFGAYRLTAGSISSNRPFILNEMLKAQTLLGERTGIGSNRLLAREYFATSAGLRRHYARFLMGADRPAEAREQLKAALRTPTGGLSRIKTLGMYLVTCLPKPFQIKWPKPTRS